MLLYKKGSLGADEDDLQELVYLSAVEDFDNLPLNPDSVPEWVGQEPTAVVNLLESDDRLDTDPFVPLFPELNHAQPGDVILLIHQWEPQPLYDVWRSRGFEDYAVQIKDDEWWVYIRK